MRRPPAGDCGKEIHLRGTTDKTKSRKYRDEDRTDDVLHESWVTCDGSPSLVRTSAAVRNSTAVEHDADEESEQYSAGSGGGECFR